MALFNKIKNFVSNAPQQSISMVKNLGQEYGEKVTSNAFELLKGIAALGTTYITDDEKFKQKVNDRLWKMLPLPIRIVGRKRLHWDSVLLGIRDKVFIIQDDKIQIIPDAKEKISNYFHSILNLAVTEDESVLKEIEDDNKRQEIYLHYKNKGYSLWSQGDRENAINALQKAVKANPDCVETWCKLGDCYDFMSSLDPEKEASIIRQKAIDCLNQAIQLQPENAKAYDMLGNVLWAEDFRKALCAFETAANLDPEYESSVSHAKRVIAECTYKLSDLKTVELQSLRERPLPDIFKYEFYYDGDIIRNAVIYSCVYGSKRQWVHAWLFNTENPDLFNEKPIGELAISSTGNPNVSKGCPVNYGLIIEQLYKEGLL